LTFGLARSAGTVAEASCRIFCFPYAGGSAAAYQGWQQELRGVADVVAVELPGRGSRFRDPLFTDLGALAAHVCDELQSQWRAPALLFGYSNGAFVAYALALELRRRNLPLPAAMILAAKPAPHIRRAVKLHDLPERAFLDRLAQLGGMSEEELSNEDLLDLFVPILRADFALSEEYHVAPEPPLDCDLVTLSGTHDAEALPNEVSDWARYFSGDIRSHVLAGGHFFLRSSRSEVLRIVRETARRVQVNRSVAALSSGHSAAAEPRSQEAR